MIEKPASEMHSAFFAAVINDLAQPAQVAAQLFGILRNTLSGEQAVDAVLGAVAHRYQYILGSLDYPFSPVEELI